MSMKDVVLYLMDNGATVALSLVVIAYAIVGAFKSVDWVSDKLNRFYKRKRKKEDEELETEDIKSTLQEMLKRMDDISAKFEVLDQKINTIEAEGKKRDCAILRDRILQACRYFGTNCRDEDGIVHIDLTEYENIKHLFEEYFGADGNSTIKKIYEEDFIPNWHINKILP